MHLVAPGACLFGEMTTWSGHTSSSREIPHIATPANGEPNPAEACKRTTDWSQASVRGRWKRALGCAYDPSNLFRAKLVLHFGELAEGGPLSLRLTKSREGSVNAASSGADYRDLWACLCSRSGWALSARDACGHDRLEATWHGLEFPVRSACRSQAGL